MMQCPLMRQPFGGGSAGSDGETDPRVFHLRRTGHRDATTTARRKNGSRQGFPPRRLLRRRVAELDGVRAAERPCEALLRHVARAGAHAVVPTVTRTYGRRPVRLRRSVFTRSETTEQKYREPRENCLSHTISFARTNGPAARRHSMEAVY